MAFSMVTSSQKCRAAVLAGNCYTGASASTRHIQAGS